MNHLFNNHKNFLIQNEADFETRYSNYFGSIIFNGVKNKYFTRPERTHPATFAYAKLIKGEVEQRPEELAAHISGIREAAVRYFQIGQFGKPKNVWNFDIKSAYAQSLFNLSLIPQTLHEKIMHLQKDTRLACVGQLASKFTHEVYEAGKLIKCEPVIANPDLRKLFFRLCIEVSLCMDTIVHELGSKFLFYWVDGIFIIDPTEYEVDLIGDIFDCFNFQFKAEKVSIERLDLTDDFTFWYGGSKGLKKYRIGKELLSSRTESILERF